MKLIKNLLKEFEFFDYDNTGHIDMDDAKRTLILFENNLKVYYKI